MILIGLAKKHGLIKNIKMPKSKEQLGELTPELMKSLYPNGFSPDMQAQMLITTYGDKGYLDDSRMSRNLLPDIMRHAIYLAEHSYVDPELRHKCWSVAANYGSMCGALEEEMFVDATRDCIKRIAAIRPYVRNNPSAENHSEERRRLLAHVVRHMHKRNPLHTEFEFMIKALSDTRQGLNILDKSLTDICHS